MAEKQAETGGAPLRAELQFQTDREGKTRVVDRRNRAVYEVPAVLVEGVRAAFRAGSVEQPAVAAWLEARHLIASPRVVRVEAWGRAALVRRTADLPRGLRPLPVLGSPEDAAARGAETYAFPEAARFSCHGCGECCRSYHTVSVTAAERSAILARAAELAPHVPAPIESWFREVPQLRPHDAPYSLGHAANGDCVFLDEASRCRIHAVLGPAAKPLTCRAFPLAVSRRPDATVVTLRAECASLARSRRDGEPLEAQRAWVESIAGGVRDPLVVPDLVRLYGEVHVPFALARAIEARALALLDAAPAVEPGLLAIRELIVAAAGSLEGPPDAADLDRTLALAHAPLEALGATWAGPEKREALRSLGLLLRLMLDAVPQYTAERGSALGEAALQRANRRLAADVLRTLYASLAARGRWPPHVEVGPAGEVEAARAAAVDAGLGDPAVDDFLRESYRHILAGGRALAAPAGAAFGYAQLALVHVLARWGARLVAHRRGATCAGAEDWNRSLGLMDRALRVFELDGAAPLVVKLFTDLFFTADLPA